MVGSLNPTKIGATKAVFHRAWPNCIVTGVAIAIPATVTAMPIGDQIRRGALYRAQAALDAAVDIGVGAEAGVQFEGERAYLLNWCVIADSEGNVYESPSPRVLLPPSFARAVRQGRELGGYIAEQVGSVDKQGGAISLLTGGLLQRQAFYEQALLCALAPLLAPELYGER